MVHVLYVLRAVERPKFDVWARGRGPNSPKISIPAADATDMGALKESEH